MTRTAGSMCTGYGGLEQAVALATGNDLDVLWHAEVAPGPAAVLDKRCPDVPNLRDITAIAWKRQPRVHLLLAGFPCQGNSNAGQRKGRADERWLWPAVLEGVVALQPAEVFIENVENLLRIDGGEAFADILTDLAGAGYHVRWTTVGACAVGLAHHRHRVFVRAARHIRRPKWTREVRPLAHLLLGQWPPLPRWPRAGRMHAGIVWAEEAPKCGAPRTGGRLLLPTPLARDGDPKQRGEGSPDYWRRRLLAGRTNGMPLGAEVTAGLTTPLSSDSQGGVREVPQVRTSSGPDHGARLRDVTPLLPTPRASDHDRGSTDARDRANGRPLPEMVRLLPTPPRASDGAKGGPGQRGSSGDLALPSAVLAQRFGAYADAIALHAHVTGVEPPDPTQPNARGDLRLSPGFAEWLMGGVPAGWVTDILDRVPALQCIGNGVVPIQGAVAYVLTGGK